MQNNNLSDEVFNELSEIKAMLIAMRDQLNQPIRKPKNELWTVEQVAKYLHKSKGTIQSHYQGKPGFPRSKKIGNKHYWIPKEIIALTRKNIAP